MEENKHALLSASTAHRWLLCTPSARLEQEVGEECSVYAKEGTAAHELAEIKLKYRFGKITVSEYQERLINFHDSENEVFYNAEFEEFVEEYVEYIIQLTSELTNYHIYFEVKVSYSNIAPQGYGTADALIVTDDCVHVVDLKFGQGVAVSAIENPQLRLYGFGALNLFPNSTKIKMTIFQPRIANCDTDEISKKDLLDWAFNVVKPQAEKAIKGEGILRADEDACRFCKLRGSCRTRADSQLAVAQQEFSITGDWKENLVQNLSVDKLSHILEIAPLFIDWFKDVQAYALGQLVQGVKIPGYKLVEGKSNRVITDENKVMEIFKKIGYTEDDLLKPREMYGITKLEALVGKKAFATLCQEYLIKPAGKLTLAPENDKRPAVTTLALAQEDFAEAIQIEVISEKE